MKFPVECKNVIDVTKPPYNADNTGKTDCTDILRRVFDDILSREAKGVEDTVKKLLAESCNKNYGYIKNTYMGFETRCECGKLYVIYPQYVPSSRIIYFPAGTYLVKDTITYTIKNLKNIFGSDPFFELCRGIHILGESKESVTIKLADNSVGFEKGTKKPVLSLNNVEGCCEKKTTNVAQLNTVEDITIDCGKGNPGAVGLVYIANNSGRVQNVDIKADEGFCGVRTAVAAEGSFVNIKAEGFDYGMEFNESHICVFDNVDFSKNKIAAFKTHSSVGVFNNVHCAPIDLFEFSSVNTGIIGKYYCVSCDMEPCADAKGNEVYTEEKPYVLHREKFPVNVRSNNADDYACVDDFGAVGDGETDCTQAIQDAFNSGKPIILFGEGHYLINGEITIPKTVKTVDFMFCDLFAGDDIIDNKDIGVFNISEDSDEMLFLENLYAYDQFYGYFRLIKHNAKRDLCMSDLHTQAASMYFNTVEGSKVYIDNCACTTGTYCMDLILNIPGRKPVYSAVIPFEFHGQSVYARQFNPERANVEVLNDNSELLIDCFKVEGPGTALKVINGGRTQVNVFTAGIGKKDAEYVLFDIEDSELFFFGGRMYGLDEGSVYNKLFKDKKGNEEIVLSVNDFVKESNPLAVSVKEYSNVTK